MSKLIQYQCDIPGCTAVRGESNHWFIAIYDPEELAIGIFAFTEKDLQESEEDYPNRCSVICGEAHVHEFISSNLNKLFPSKDESEATRLMGEAEASEVALNASEKGL